MFDYEDISDENIDKLESEKPENLAAAVLLLIHGIRKGIVTEKKKGLTQLNNILLAIIP